MSLADADVLLLGIYDEDNIRKSLHILDSAEVLLELIKLFAKSDNLFLGKYFERSVLSHLLDVFKTFNTALYRLEVCKHSAEPSLIYIEHSAACSLCCYGILCLLLCSDKKNSSSVCGNITDSVICIIDHAYCFLKVNDVYSVSLSVDVRSHFRIPFSRLMSEMNSRLE